MELSLPGRRMLRQAPLAPVEPPRAPPPPLAPLLALLPLPGAAVLWAILPFYCLHLFNCNGKTCNTGVIFPTRLLRQRPALPCSDCGDTSGAYMYGLADGGDIVEWNPVLRTESHVASTPCTTVTSVSQANGFTYDRDRDVMMWAFSSTAADAQPGFFYWYAALLVLSAVYECTVQCARSQDCVLQVL